MALLNDTRTGPPGGWRYVQPETGCEVIGLSLPELIERVIQHRAYKGINPKDAESVIIEVQRQICTGIDKRFCRAEPGEDHQPTVDVVGELTVSRVVAGSIVFVSWIKRGAALVEKTESERRAKICRGCRFNRHADGCGSCNAMYSLIEAGIPKERLEPGLKACGACGCALKAKVLMPADVLATDRRKITYPVHCWNRN